MNWDERHTMQRRLYEMVTSYVSKTYAKAARNRKKNMCLIFLLIIMQRMVSSSTAAIRQSLERRLFVLKEQTTKLSSLTEEEISEMDIEDGAEEAIEAISLNNKEEIAELTQIIETAKQAEFQHNDVKVEELQDIIDKILSADPTQKIIVFTEFVATQKYLADYLRSKDYTVSILNGTMSIDERNDALREFRDSTQIFISTDAGGEGLNLQFSNIIINYDLPWNPMKIEQRCGRVDRIGQTRDVEIYNFIITDTVENRVREVLEEKLSVILKEMGVDKYSDVLDSEVADMDFTDVYMRSIEKPYKIEENMYPVESEMKQQLSNVRKYKSVITEDKDLTQLVGKGPDFDVEKALRMMLSYYDGWKGIDPRLIDRLGINDPEITEHLQKDILQDKFSPILSVSIENFPNEAGYFMLWQLSVSDEEADHEIIPVFVNENGTLRGMAGRRIMDVFLDPNSRLHTQMTENISSEEYRNLERLSMDYAYDAFSELRDKQKKRIDENYQKYLYALNLREEAAQRIGIDNIRESKIAKLHQEREALEKEYKEGAQIYPDFRQMLLVKLEA